MSKKRTRASACSPDTCLIYHQFSARFNYSSTAAWAATKKMLNISILRQVWAIFRKHFKHILRILHEYIMSKKVPYNP